MASYSFFDTDNEHVDRILKKVNGAQFEGHTISVEVSAAAKSSGPAKKSSNFSREKRSFGGGRPDKKPGSQGGFNKRRRDY
jgi:ATP-dependent RNA helicase DeaD